MDTPLKSFTARISMGKNSRTVTKGVTKKRSSGRKIKMTKKEKRIRIMSLKRYILTSSSLAMTHLSAKIKQSTGKLRKCLLLTQDIRHIW